MTKPSLLLLPVAATLVLAACTTLEGGQGDGATPGNGDAPCDDPVECSKGTGTAAGVDILSADFSTEAGVTADAEPVGEPQDLIPACGNMPTGGLLVGSDFAFAPTRGYASAGHVAALLLRPEPVLPDPRAIRTADFVNMYGTPVDATSKAQIAVVSMRKSVDGADVIFDVETSVPVPASADARPPTHAVVLFAESASLLGSDHGDAFGVQKDVVRSLVSGLVPSDRVWLAGWGAGFRVALEDATPDKVEPALATFTKPSSSGKLETAIENGVRLLSDAGNQGHVFVLFDGSVPASKRLDDALESARGAGVLVHAIVVNESGYFDRVGIERFERGGGASVFLSSRARSTATRVFELLSKRSDELFGRAFDGVEGTLFHPDTFVPVLPDSLDNGVGAPRPVGPGRFITARHVFSAPAEAACNATFALSYAFDKSLQTAVELPTVNTLYNPAVTSDETTLVTVTRVEAIQRVVAFLKVAGSLKPDITSRFARNADLALTSIEHDTRVDELTRIFCVAADLSGVTDFTNDAPLASCAP